MPIDKTTALNQIYDVLSVYESELGTKGDISPLDFRKKSRVMTRMKALVSRLAPPGSEYLKTAMHLEHPATLHGIVQALRDDYESDCLLTFRELVVSELCSDFLEMGEYLLQDEKLKQPAAVLAGGVLEEHLRNLSTKNGVDTKTAEGKPRKADTINADLKKAGAYGKNEQKQVTAWLGIRNSAAHAKYDEFEDAQVSLMISGLRDFIAKYPA